MSDSGEAGNVEAGPRMIVALFRLQLLTNQEWRSHNRRALALCQRHPEISPRVYARLLGVVAGALAGEDLPRAVAGLTEAVELSRRLGEAGKHILMWNLSDLSNKLASTDDLERAAATNAEAVAILHELGPDSFPPGRYVYYLGHGASANARLANKRGRYTEAKAHRAESIELYRQAGFGIGEFDGTLEIGHACLELGELDQAREAFLKARQWSLDAARTGDNDSLAHVSRCLGIVELKQGHLDLAFDYCQTSLREAYAGHFQEFLASSLGLAAALWAKRGQPVRAAGLSGASTSLYRSTGRTPWEDSSLDTLLPGWRLWSNQTLLSRAFDAGSTMSVEQMFAYALGDNPE
jgi:tetratricopeptide (TPR) repeat protein